jgi:hypothetical protein
VTTGPPRQISSRGTSTCYLAEVTLRIRAGSDLAWIRESLDAAERRLLGSSLGTDIVSAVFTPDDAYEPTVVEASSREDVLRLFEIALLPSAQVLDVVVVELHARERKPG